MIDDLYLNINGRIDEGNPVVSLCCENIENRPAISLCKTAKETLEKFLGMRSMILAESINVPQRRVFL